MRSTRIAGTETATQNTTVARRNGDELEQQVGCCGVTKNKVHAEIKASLKQIKQREKQLRKILSNKNIRAIDQVLYGMTKTGFYWKEQPSRKYHARARNLEPASIFHDRLPNENNPELANAYTLINCVEYAEDVAQFSPTEIETIINGFCTNLVSIAGGSCVAGRELTEKCFHDLDKLSISLDDLNLEERTTIKNRLQELIEESQIILEKAKNIFNLLGRKEHRALLNTFYQKSAQPMSDAMHDRGCYSLRNAFVDSTSALNTRYNQGLFYLGGTATAVVIHTTSLCKSALRCYAIQKNMATIIPKIGAKIEAILQKGSAMAALEQTTTLSERVQSELPSTSAATGYQTGRPMPKDRQTAITETYTDSDEDVPTTHTVHAEMHERQDIAASGSGTAASRSGRMKAMTGKLAAANSHEHIAPSELPSTSAAAGGQLRRLTQIDGVVASRAATQYSNEKAESGAIPAAQAGAQLGPISKKGKGKKATTNAINAQSAQHTTTPQEKSKQTPAVLMTRQMKVSEADNKTHIVGSGQNRRLATQSIDHSTNTTALTPIGTERRNLGDRQDVQTVTPSAPYEEAYRVAEVPIATTTAIAPLFNDSNHSISTTPLLDLEATRRNQGLPPSYEEATRANDTQAQQVHYKISHSL